MLVDPCPLGLQQLGACLQHEHCCLQTSPGVQPQQHPSGLPQAPAALAGGTQHPPASAALLLSLHLPPTHTQTFSCACALPGRIAIAHSIAHGSACSCFTQDNTSPTAHLRTQASSCFEQQAVRRSQQCLLVSCSHSVLQAGQQADALQPDAAVQTVSFKAGGGQPGNRRRSFLAQ